MPSSPSLHAKQIVAQQLTTLNRKNFSLFKLYNYVATASKLIEYTEITNKVIISLPILYLLY